MTGDGFKKGRVLDKEGFIYHYRRMIYVNAEKEKIFSHRAIESNSVKWLERKIKESNDWQFYFTDPVSEQIKHSILREIKQRR